ncbi:hypothetical protein EON66_00325 [archaeon]|nr:MAG: hypothetical protein EON66_00325 [archaeon]
MRTAALQAVYSLFSQLFSYTFNCKRGAELYFVYVQDNPHTCTPAPSERTPSLPLPSSCALALRAHNAAWRLDFCVSLCARCTELHRLLPCAPLCWTAAPRCLMMSCKLFTCGWTPFRCPGPSATLRATFQMAVRRLLPCHCSCACTRARVEVLHVCVGLRMFACAVLAVMMAEVVAHFYPKLVELHNYSAANSVRQKLYNWSTLNRTCCAAKRFCQLHCALLRCETGFFFVRGGAVAEKVFKRLGFEVRKSDVEAVVNCKPGVIESIILQLQQRVRVVTPATCALPVCVRAQLTRTRGSA